MTLILGFATVLGLVFGGFVLSGGSFGVILHALPYEGMMIGGAAIGSFIIANSFATIKQSVAGIMKVMKGPKWKANDYLDLLSFMFELTTMVNTKGVNAAMSQLEDPHDSELFAKYPRIQKDHHVAHMISDLYRVESLGFTKPMEKEDLMDKQLKKHHHEVLAPAGAIQNMADALPAIGIVAAVLGVIKTMSSIDKPPEVLGGMIGGALVGTFLGVFLAYCLVNPIANRLKAIEDTDAAFLNVVRDIIIASSKGNKPVVAVEVGRAAIPTAMQPNFAEVEQVQTDIKNAS